MLRQKMLCPCPHQWMRPDLLCSPGRRIPSAGTVPSVEYCETSASTSVDQFKTNLTLGPSAVTSTLFHSPGFFR